MDGRDPLAGLAARLGHDFADADLLRLAVAHRSWVSETGAAASNERLEFLGDAVLGLVVAEHAFREAPDLDEGRLTEVRKAVVNASALAEVAAAVGLGDAVLLGKGEAGAGGRAKVSILADAMEAVLGAVYLDGGWESARALVLRLFAARLADAVAGGVEPDRKTQLQELVSRLGRGAPRYELSETGPDHAKRFTAEVFVGSERAGRGEGRSKKQAEQAAAREAWLALAAPDGA